MVLVLRAHPIFLCNKLQDVFGQLSASFCNWMGESRIFDSCVDIRSEDFNGQVDVFLVADYDAFQAGFLQVIAEV